MHAFCMLYLQVLLGVWSEENSQYSIKYQVVFADLEVMKRLFIIFDKIPTCSFKYE